MATGGEIRDKLGEIRKHILLLLYREREAIGTRELRQKLREDYGVELPRGSKELHFSTLGDGDENREIEGWELIEEAYRAGGNIEERHWQLTERGVEFVEEWLLVEGSRIDDEEHESRFDRLVSRVEALEKQHDRQTTELQETTDQQQQELDNLWDRKVDGERAEEIEARVEQLKDYVREQVRDAITELRERADEIERRLDMLDEVTVETDNQVEEIEEHVEALREEQREQREAVEELVDEVEELREDEDDGGLFGLGGRAGGDQS